VGPTNGVKTSIHSSNSFVQPNKKEGRSHSNPIFSTKHEKGRSCPQNEGRLCSAPVAPQPNTRLLLGNMAFGRVSSRSARIANFEPSIRRGFVMCSKDLAGTLTLLEPCVYCSHVLTCPRSAQRYGASTPKVRIDQGPPLVEEGPVLNGKGQ
jgi:hypothetical protein